MCVPGLAEGLVVWAAVWYHMEEFITVTASSPALMIHSNAAEGLGLEAAAWRKRDVKKRQQIYCQKMSLYKRIYLMSYDLHRRIL